MTDKELLLADGLELEKCYGCTLIACVQTPHFWFAFQIGDGKCVSLDENAWSEPIPWDDACFLNRTTSICDSAALDEFRYCYGQVPPVAVFIGSDGVDDSFGEMEYLADFYIELAKLLSEDESEAFSSLEEALQELSKIRSKDDMSCAIIYNKEQLCRIIPNLLQYQVDMMSEKREQLAQDITDLQSELIILECFKDGPINYQRSEYEYQLKLINRLIKELDEYDAKLLSRRQALDSHSQNSIY